MFFTRLLHHSGPLTWTMIQIERMRFRYIWSMMTRSIHDWWNIRNNKRVRTNICKTLVFVFSVRNINNFGRILPQFTGLVLCANNVAAKHGLLTERTGLEKSESVALRKNGPKLFCFCSLFREGHCLPVRSQGCTYNPTGLPVRSHGRTLTQTPN